MKKYEMGRTCRTHGIDKNAYNISVVKLRGRDHLEYTGVDGRIMLEWILGK
jgi:hypothetical protein